MIKNYRTNIKRKNLIKKMIEQIIDGARPQKIILFGSHAYGNPNRNSDIDLLVVMPSKKRPVERAVEISRLLKYYPLPVDLLVRTPGEIKKRISLGDCFFEEILQKGIVLYER